MDRRWYFAAGDLLASLLVGVLAAAAAWLIVPAGVNMWAAMAAMMPLGMIIGLVLFFPMGALLGAQEAMIPAMYSGMWAAMVVGMMSAMMPLSLSHALQMGAACGIAETVFLWAANTLLRGKVRTPGG